MKKSAYLLLFFLLVNLGRLKAGGVDSLLALVKQSKSDTQTVKLYAKIGVECDIEDILQYCNKGLAIIESKKLNSDNPDYKVYQTERARIYNNIGFYYYFKLNTLKSIDYYQKAILLLEQLQTDNDLLASLYNNVSSQYILLKNYRKPVYYLTKVIAIDKANKNESMLALDYGNLSSSYYYLDKRDSCTLYSKKSLAIRRKLKDQEGEITTLYNIGSNYFRWKDFDKAEKYFAEGFKKFLQLESFQDSSLLINIFLWEGKWRLHAKEYKQAEQYLNKAYALCFQTGRFTEIIEVTNSLYKLYSETGNSKKALIFYKKYKAVYDSSYNANIEHQASINDVKFDYGKKEILMKVQQEKELALEKEKQTEQRRLLFISLFVIVLTIIFSLVIYNRWKLLLKQKSVIETQQRQLMRQSQQLQETNVMLDKRNQTITDSINSALNVQNALLPGEHEIRELLGEESMVLFMPKDLVSGDFFLIKLIGRYIYIVLADCTGHGVSGAFISVLSIKSIEKIINTNKAGELVEQTLKQLHMEFLFSFSKSNESGFGIDLVVALYDTAENKLRFSGSGNSVFIVSNGKLNEYKFKNLQIGKLNYNIPETEIVEVNLNQGDCIYAATDGYSDQVGEATQKRFSSPRLKQLLTDNSSLSMTEQKGNLEKAINEWKGCKEQYDDITIIGWKA